MAKTTHIEIIKRRPSRASKALNHIILWGILLGVTGGSRIWFGGAWVIDVFALFLAVGWAIFVMRHSFGQSADLTREEMKDWVSDGMPDDIKAWKEGRKTQ